MEPNWAGFKVICGMPGCGKSSLADKLICEITAFKNAIVYITENDLLRSNTKGQAFHRIAYLPAKDLGKYTGGKIKLSNNEIEVEQLLSLVNKSYRNGILVIDEAALYNLCWKNPNNNRVEPIPAFKEILQQRRKINVEVILMYHEISLIPVQLFAFITHLVLFYQTGAIRNSASIPSYRVKQINEMIERITRIHDSGNRYYYEVLKIG